MSRLLRLRQLLAAVAILLVAPALLAKPAPKAVDPLRDTIDLPLPADHPLAMRLDAHRREAASHHFGPDQQPGAQLHGLHASVTAAEYANVPKTKWSIVHQDITLDVAPSKAELQADVIVTLTTDAKDVQEITLRTDTLSKVNVTLPNGQLLKAKYKDLQPSIGLLTVELPVPLTPGVDSDLHVTYEAKLKCSGGGYRLKPCNFDSVYSTVAFFRYYLGHGSVTRHPFTSDLYIITPHNRSAAAPGVPMGATKLDDGRLSWRFKQPEKTQNAGFSIAAYGIAGDEPAGMASGEPFVRVYSQGKYAGNGATMVALAKAVIQFAGERMGPFPWAGVNLIQVAQNFGGGYAPLSGIFMLQYVFGTKQGGQGWNSTVELTAHEMAHQWWGNYVRPATHNDTSLSESLAEFTSCLYTEKTLETRSQIIGDNLSYVYTVKTHEDRPLGSVAAHSSNKYVQIMYHKGAVVMDMLRIELGEQQWLDALKAFAKKFGRDYARWQDLGAVVNEETGKDYGWYFQQWFANTGYIRGEITSKVTHLDDGGSKVRLRFGHLSTKPMRFRLPLRVTYADRSTEDVFVDILPQDDTHISVAEKSFDKKVVAVRPDLGRRLLRRFSVLTPGDVDLNGLTDGRDLIELGFRMRRGIVFTNNSGQQSFYPNALWDEIYDVSPNFRLDLEDVDALDVAVGAEAINF